MTSNGATSSSSKSPSTLASKPTASKAPVAKKPGNVVVNAFRRKLPTSAASSSSKPIQPSRTGSNGIGATNALPPEHRARIEALRAQEREKEIEREAEAQVKRRSMKQAESNGAARKTSKKRRQDDFIDSEDEDLGSGSSKRSIGRSKASKSNGVDDEDDDLFGSGTDTRGTPSTSSRKPSRKTTPATSTSAYTYMGRQGVVQPYHVPRPATTDAETYKSYIATHSPPISSAQLIEEAMAKKPKGWGAFFKDLPASPPPRCTLDYPAEGASEEFILLVSRDRDEYDPISDLLRSVYVIVKYYLSAEQRELFGELDELEMGSAAGQIWSGPMAPITPGLDGASSPSVNSAPGTPSHQPSGLAVIASPIRNGFAETGSATPLDFGSSTEVSSILRSFTKSRNRRSGHLFLHTVSRFNNTLASLRTAGALQSNIAQTISSVGLADDIWTRVQDQAYARTVGPRVDELGDYRSFSDNVYGELTPRFMSEIAQLCQLKPGSVMVDLGCGVGNLVVQTALQVGCECHGIESMPTPAALGVAQVEEAKKRWKMWCLDGGSMNVWRGDFTTDTSLSAIMTKADVVIVNNYAFTPTLNDQLSLLFLDLPSGCQIISLKPFVPHDFRLTQRNHGSVQAILSVQERQYGTGMVSWAERGGKYYIAKVDRDLVREFLEKRGSDW